MVNPTRNIHDDVIKWKHFPRYWHFMSGIHRSPVVARKCPCNASYCVSVLLQTISSYSLIWYDSSVINGTYLPFCIMYTRIGKPVSIKRCFSDRLVQTGILIASLTANNAYVVWHHLGFNVYLIIQYGTFDTKQADILAQAKCYSDWNRNVVTYTVKPVCNDHLYNKIYYL